MKSITSQLFLRTIRPKCPFCSKIFSQTNLPTIVCPDQHLCCAQCYETKVKTHRGIKCRHRKCKKRTNNDSKGQSLKLFSQVLEFYNKIMTLAQIDEKNSSKFVQYNEKISQTAQSMFYKAQELLLMRQIESSLSICKEVIKLKPLQWKNFKGLGHPINVFLCNEQAQIQCYRKHKQTEKQRSVYDLLNVCVSIKNDFLRQEKWFIDQLGKKLSSEQLYMGLGILYYANKNMQKSKNFLKLAYEINKNLYINFLYFQAFQFIFNGKPTSDQFYQFCDYQMLFFNQPYQRVDFQKLPSHLRTLRIFKGQSSQNYCLSFFKPKKQLKYVQQNLQQFWIKDQNYQCYDGYYIGEFQRLYERDGGYYYPLNYILGRFYIFKQAQFIVISFIIKKYLSFYSCLTPSPAKAIHHFEIYLKYVKPQTLNAIKTKFYLAYAYSMLPQFPRQKIQLAAKYINEYISQTEKRSEKINIQANWILAKIYKQQKLIKKAMQIILIYQSQHPPAKLKVNSSHSYMSAQQNRQEQRTFHHKCWLLMAQLYSLNHSLDLSVLNYEKYLQVFKNDQLAQQKFMDVLLKIGDINKIESVMMNKQRLSSTEALFKLGSIYRQRKNEEKSLLCYLKCFNNDLKYAKDIELLSYVCQMLVKFQRFDEALNWAEKLKQFDPTNPKRFRLLSKIYSHLAEYNQNIGNPRKIIHTQQNIIKKEGNQK